LVLSVPIVLSTVFVHEGRAGDHAGEVQQASPAEPASGASAACRFFAWWRSILGGVGAFALLGLVGIPWVIFGGAIGARGSGDMPASIDPSIAVLPVDDLNPEGNEQFFVEGLSEEIIKALAQIAGLQVSQRTSAFAFQGSGLDIRRIAGQPRGRKGPQGKRT